MQRCLLLLLVSWMAACHAQAETLVERGHYLVEVLAACGNCHTPRDHHGPLPEQHLAGGRKFEEGFGMAFAPNLTPDSETGLGLWTDAEIIRAIREGQGRDGQTMGPPMPYAMYRDIADRDVQAMVAYLRTVPTVRNRVPRSHYTHALPARYGPPVTTVPEPPREDLILYGAYVAGPLAHCLTCHTPLGADRRPDLTRRFAGGRAFHGPHGTSYAANLTPDPATGLGAWSEAQIIQAIYGVRPDGRVLLPPMPWPHYAGNIRPPDLQALLAYLRSLPPIANQVPPPVPPPQ